MVESFPSPWYVPGSVSMTAPPSENMAVVIGMMNDRSGLWTITTERISLLREFAPRLSARVRGYAQEMIDIASSGERLWQTKAEYYAVLVEIRNNEATVTKKKIDETIAHFVRGSRADGISDRPWVKQALEVLTRISRER